MNRLRKFLDAILGRPRSCPHCGAPYAGYPESELAGLESTLEPGLYVVCLACAGLILVGPDLGYSRPTPEDLDRLAGSPRATIVRREQRAVRRKLDREAARRKGGGPW